MDIKDQKKPVEIFCCYAHEDRTLLMELKNHLKLWERLQRIVLWTDMDISPGENWRKEIARHLDSAHIILFLVSKYFLASDYCYSTEMTHAMERYQRKEVCVVPIILRHCIWEDAPFGELQALPSEAKPIASSGWHTQDEAWADVARGLRKVITTVFSGSGIKQIHSHVLIEELRSQDDSVDQETQSSTLHLLEETLGLSSQAMASPDSAATLLPMNAWLPPMPAASTAHLSPIKSIKHVLGLLACGIVFILYWLAIGYTTPKIFPQKILRISGSTYLMMLFVGNNEKIRLLKALIILLSLVIDWFLVGTLLSGIPNISFFALPYTIVSFVYGLSLLFILLCLAVGFSFLNVKDPPWPYVNVVNFRKILEVTLVTSLLTLASQLQAFGAAFLYFPIVASVVSLCLFFYGMFRLGDISYADKVLKKRKDEQERLERESEAYFREKQK
jgi:hypothetical protein